MKKNNGARERLVQELVAKGFSVRKARKAVNAVINVMISGVHRGEAVEIPGGTIQTAWREGKSKIRLTRFRNVQTKEITPRFVTFFRQRIRVKFTPDLTLDLSPLVLPPPPPTPQQIETCQLAAELVGKPPTDHDMLLLERAAAVHPTRPVEECLLRRLRNLKARGWTYRFFDFLAADVEWLYWV